MLPAGLNWKLMVLGDGPCSVKWQKLARADGVADRCEWFGQVPRAAVLEKMQAAHLLVITSIYDLTSTVLVEALATGLPVICPDHFGFADAINAECGIKIPAASMREIVAGLRDGIVRLSDENVRLRLAEGALRQSAQFEWDLKARAVSDIYYKKHALSRNRIAETIERTNGSN
jgi:glycosyltransferase involved in cell wall biosynthesis